MGVARGGWDILTPSVGKLEGFFVIGSTTLRK
jgi:hypothetical protein